MENNPENSTVPPVEMKTKHKRGGNAWWALILILIGVIMLVQNITGATFEFHWWALFIFIPVFGSLSTAWDGIREGGRFTTKVGGSLGSAVLVATIATILLFGLDWTRWWPLVILAGGFSMVMTGLGKMDRTTNSTLSALSRLTSWVGLGGMALGLGFLVKTTPIPALQPMITGYQWWAVPILIAGLGALVNTLVIFFENEHQMDWTAWSMLLISVFILAIGALVLLRMDINLLFPIVLIACGLVILIGLIQKK
jgi:hypothetical protein